jgi:hypothetical protein
MQTSPPVSHGLVRHAIAARCMPGSWFAMRPLLIRMQTSPEAGPELLADLLSMAGARSDAQAKRLQRQLSQALWRASAAPDPGAVQHLMVHCGAAHWTLRLLLRPQLHIETIRG